MRIYSNSSTSEEQKLELAIEIEDIQKFLVGIVEADKVYWEEAKQNAIENEQEFDPNDPLLKNDYYKEVTERDGGGEKREVLVAPRDPNSWMKARSGISHGKQKGVAKDFDLKELGFARTPSEVPIVVARIDKIRNLEKDNARKDQTMMEMARYTFEFQMWSTSPQGQASGAPAPVMSESMT